MQRLCSHCCTGDAFTGTAPVALPFEGFPTGVKAGVYSSAYPGGEIRGFLVAAPVPEPAGWAMLAGGLAGLLRLGRRRRWEVSWQK